MNDLFAIMDLDIANALIATGSIQVSRRRKQFTQRTPQLISRAADKGEEADWQTRILEERSEDRPQETLNTWLVGSGRGLDG